MLLPELPRGDLIPFFERTDQVAAVCKAGLGGNKVQVIIGKEEQVLDLVQTDKFDILLAALPIVFLKQLGKVRIAHIVFMRQLFDVDILL